MCRSCGSSRDISYQVAVPDRHHRSSWSWPTSLPHRSATTTTMFVYRAGGNTQEAQAGGIFTNLSYDDKQAFFSLLDEYFASRPHLSGGGGGGNSSVGAGVTSPPPPSRSSGPPAANPASRPAAHASPPSVSYTPSPPAAPSSGGPAAFVNSGLGKVAGNQHLSGALGKIGAGGFAKSMDKKFNAPQSRHGTVGRGRSRLMAGHDLT